LEGAFLRTARVRKSRCAWERGFLAGVDSELAVGEAIDGSDAPSRCDCCVVAVAAGLWLEENALVTPRLGEL